MLFRKYFLGCLFCLTKIAVKEKQTGEKSEKVLYAFIVSVVYQLVY